MHFKFPDKKFTEAKIGNLLQHYATNLWNEVGVFLEHVVLWWGSSPLASLPPGCSQQLREWLLQPKNRGNEKLLLLSEKVYYINFIYHL